MGTPQAKRTAYPKSSDRRDIMRLKNQKKPQVAVVQSMNAESGEEKPMQKASAWALNAYQFSSVQSLSRVWLSAGTMDCSTPGLPVHHQLPELAQSHVPLSWWCQPTILSSVIPFSSCLQSFPASGSFLMSHFFTSWPKYWSCSFSISPSNEYSGVISFRIDWFDLLEVQGTLKSLLQNQISKSTNSSALSFLCSPTLISIHDYWKNHSFD